MVVVMGYAGIKRNIERKGFKKTLSMGMRHRANLLKARKVLSCRSRMSSGGKGSDLLEKLIAEEKRLETKDEIAFAAYMRHIERKRDTVVLPKLTERYLGNRALILSDFDLREQ